MLQLPYCTAPATKNSSLLHLSQQHNLSLNINRTRKEETAPESNTERLVFYSLYIYLKFKNTP